MALADQETSRILRILATLGFRFKPCSGHSYPGNSSICPIELPSSRPPLDLSQFHVLINESAQSESLRPFRILPLAAADSSILLFLIHF
ncbi:hypothetical protein L596_028265 [Steinernema carpocapsae]|uniref:Uncharacterized protein n=1 Tax=Steinernema carpocapsae TaxID=34508 RepID=A0A4U5LY07_STECR|nr:hypothetical protein L596_028265 [Steinernema carpocapsae]